MWMTTVIVRNAAAVEKPRFFLVMLDHPQSGHLTRAQAIAMLETSFATAKLEVMGTDFSTVVELMFQEANVCGEWMTYPQFYHVLQSYADGDRSKSPSIDRPVPVSIHVSKKKPSSLFAIWYDTNCIRIWWLLIYVIANNVAFWLKWYAYKVDPALGYGLRLARGCAQVVMLNVLLVLLPMCRSITAVLKRSKLAWRFIPFDDHIDFHKLTGSVCLTAGLVHTMAHNSNEICLYLIATEDDITASVFVEREVDVFANGRPPFTTMLQAIPVWTVLILLVITLISFPLAAIPRLRQGNFNLFWFAHMLFGIFLVVLCFHGATS